MFESWPQRETLAVGTLIHLGHPIAIAQTELRQLFRKGKEHMNRGNTELIPILREARPKNSRVVVGSVTSISIVMT